MEDKLARERRFHDQAFSDGVRSSVRGCYALAREARDVYNDLLLSDCTGKRVLEYGCGTGSLAFDLAGHGASVTGIDISEVAIGLARTRAADAGADITFTVMNAEAMSFPDRSFDLVCGSGILHHLDIRSGYGEIARVLRDGGMAVFGEPLGHNPAISMFRYFTPSLRTVDEHPLLARDIALAQTYFADVSAQCFCLLTLALAPLRRTRVFPRLLCFGEGLDRWLIRICPPLKWYAWQTVMVLSSPHRQGFAEGRVSPA